MTMQEKVDFLGGDGADGAAGADHGHTGTQNGVPRLGVPAVYYSDGPVGPRQGASIGLPAPIGLAATFDPALARLHGQVAAREAKLKGNDVIFGPTLNMMRIPMGGRTFEAYGEDPYLTARMGVAWIQGAQGEGVIGDVKHFATNNQENGRQVQDSVVDERTLREIYLPQFEAAVKEAGVGTVMCAYNRLNGPFACESERLLETILRREWGFTGYVVSDYGAAHSAIAAMKSGLDFEPGEAAVYTPWRIRLALLSGLVTTAELDEHVRAILRTWFAFGLLDRAAYRDDDAQIDKGADAAASTRVAEASIALLRNEGAILPLRASRLHSIAVIGKPATTFTTGGGSGAVRPFSFVTALDGIRARAGTGVAVTYSDGSDANAAAQAARAADVAIVVAGDRYAEGADRSCLTLECPNVFGDQDGLIAKVAGANRRTIVVLESGGPDLTPWRGSVAALLEAWYPGGNGGTAIARVLFGDADPAGRLPVTFPADPGQIQTAGDSARYPGDLAGLETRYSEGVFVGYRWYDAHRLEPAYPFGHGLSYTSFSLSRLRVSPAPGGAPGARVVVTVKNTGRRTGVVVPQLYLSLPGAPGVSQPPVQLRGFRRLSLRRGKSARIAFTLDERAFSHWSTEAGGWRVAPGCAGVLVGTSSRDLPLRGTIALGGARC
jgi:beta-glucosidase